MGERKRRKWRERRGTVMKYQTFLSFFFFKISSFPLQRGANCIYGLVEPPTLERPFYINFSLFLFYLSLLISFFFLLLPTSISCTDFFPFSFLRIYHASSFCVSECVSVCVCVLVCSSWTDYNLFYHSSSSISSSCFSISF